MFDKADKKLILDEETKNLLRRLKIEKKLLIKKYLGNIKKFREYFSYEPTALVNKLLGANTQDLKKSLNEIKQQKIKLNEDERNSTNNKNKYDELNNILIVIDKINQFFEYKFLSGKQADESELPKLVNINKERFNEILSTISKAKNEGLRTNVDGKEITLDDIESLLKDLSNRILDRGEFENRYNDILNNVEAIVNKASITRSQKKNGRNFIAVKRNSKTQKI